MENYVKGTNADPEIELSDLPFKCLPPNVTWMKVRPGSKMTNLIEFALKSMEDNKTQVWSGTGAAIGKTISCVEIMKRKIQNLHQISKISYHKCEEYWNPKSDELDSLRVVRSIPLIHILLSIEPLDSNEPGYQSSQVDVKTTEAPGKMKKKSRARNKNYHNFGTK
ncbi:ribonuclease P protein subunit p25-like protein [Daphnia pulicaria]|uniref:ribonuclease P protein subunit p25-like protein n=1 Tax=Daphnia pulicaria TaxID=35523 RepID=UPI001EEB6667|nr:ribonuclease P protein subunit p25-like protein [Daphnia pulicaria]